MSDWWVTATGADHEQGDLQRCLPVVTVESLTIEGDQAQIRTRVEHLDAIIVTQTCDLENSKVENILVARVLAWEDFAAAQYGAGNTAVKGGSFHRSLVRGDVPPLSLLHQQDEPAVQWSVVDFRELHVVSRSTLDRHVQETEPRARLVSPYKEHFAQAFARFYMRVGLPHDARAFEKDGAAAVAGLG